MDSPGKKSRRRRLFVKLAVVCFWLLLWEIISIRVNEEILVASPVAVLKTLFILVRSLDFWQTIFFSFARIVLL